MWPPALKTRRETTAAGLFVIAPVQAGTYKVTASASGFRTVVQEQVIVDALATVELNLKLEVGATTESVTVSAAPPDLNTSDARMGQTIRNEMYTALPLTMGNGNPRNPAAFIYLMPGVQEGGTFGFINGGQSFSKDVYIEGLPITDAVRQGESRALQYGVSVEAVEQFQVETSGTSVEFNGQGSENYTIKSGTNQFHGSAFEYLRNTVLRRPRLLRAEASAAESESVRLHVRRPDQAEQDLLLRLLRRLPLSRRHRLPVRHHPHDEDAHRRLQRAAGGHLRSRHHQLPGRRQLQPPGLRRQHHPRQPALVGVEVLPGVRCPSPLIPASPTTS